MSAFLSIWLQAMTVARQLRPVEVVGARVVAVCSDGWLGLGETGGVCVIKVT